MKSKLDEPFSRTVFWLAFPFLLFFVGSLFYLVAAYGRGSLSGYAFLALVCVPCVCFGLVLYDAKKFWWARRILALAVFFMYAVYAWSEIRASPGLFSLGVLNALAGFLLVGFPAITYFFRGVITIDAALALWVRFLSPLNAVHLWGKRSPPMVQPETLPQKAREQRDAKWYGKP